ncbi:MAG: S6e family ribosomal protein [Candidatus Woesearchaeota archaeon]
MAEFKLVIGDPASKKSYPKELKDKAANFFIGKKIGETIKGESIDMPGYEFQITGGSDISGIPMRKGIVGQARKMILAGRGTGFRENESKVKIKKSVRGEVIGQQTIQINLKVLKQGSQPLGGEEKKEAVQ